MAEIPGWYNEFVAAVVVALPADIDEAAAGRWVQDPDGLRRALADLADAGGLGALRNDKSPEGWRLVKDVEEPAALAVAGIAFDALSGADDLIGEPMVALIREMEGLLGQRHAEYVLDRSGDIPEEYQRYALVFPGTIWESPDGNHQVPCLTYRQGTWDMIFGILEGGFDSRDILARPRG